MSELIFLLLLFGLPAVCGFILARRRGKNPLLWGALSGVFPFFLVILYMQYKPAIKPADGAVAAETKETTATTEEIQKND